MVQINFFSLFEKKQAYLSLRRENETGLFPAEPNVIFPNQGTGTANNASALDLPASAEPQQGSLHKAIRPALQAAEKAR